MQRRIRLRKDIGRHEMRPPFYGRAYERYESDLIVCYPIPLNWVIGLLREIAWYFARGPHGLKNRELKALLRKEYRRGFEDGRQGLMNDLVYGLNDNAKNQS